MNNIVFIFKGYLIEYTCINNSVIQQSVRHMSDNQWFNSHYSDSHKFDNQWFDSHKSDNYWLDSQKSNNQWFESHYSTVKSDNQ